MYNCNLITGIRPTGKIHFGHYFGIIKKIIKLQNKFSCLFFIADLHSLSNYKNLKNIKLNIKQILIDCLNIGINPKKTILFIQSKVKEHKELYFFLSTITSIKLLKHLPNYKYLKKCKKNINNITFTYPLLQASDILIYNTNKVLVGYDQIPNIEFVKKLSYKFNLKYKKKVFKIPKIILSNLSNVPGIDGTKMSKSNKNFIELKESKKNIKKKIKIIKTDKKRIYKSIPGNTNKCNI